MFSEYSEEKLQARLAARRRAATYARQRAEALNFLQREADVAARTLAEWASKSPELDEATQAFGHVLVRQYRHARDLYQWACGWLSEEVTR